jgi:hypothetical protein
VVVCCCVVVAGRTAVVSCVVVVVVVAGSFTTVVQEVIDVAKTAKARRRMISFFIGLLDCSKDNSGHGHSLAVSAGKFFTDRKTQPRLVPAAYPLFLERMQRFQPAKINAARW